MGIAKVIVNGVTTMDVTQTTATADKILQGYGCIGADGEWIDGMATGGGTPTLQSKTATPTTSQQTVAPDTGYDGLSQVTVNPIPSQYVVPTGTKSISENGTGINVAQYASVDVAVEDSTLVVTLSYNESTEMWEPDCTYVEVQSAYQAGKNIVVDLNGTAEDGTADGEWSTVDGRLHYVVHKWEDGVIFESGYTFNIGDTIFVDFTETYRTVDGIITLTNNDTTYDVSQYESAYVNVPSSTPSLQSKSVSYTPSETAQSATVTAESGYDGLSSVDVSVGAISSTYVGSGITRHSSTDLTASGAMVTVPAGYYSAQASKAVASGTAGTPTATKGTVSNHSVTVTPSVTNTAGYITGGTKSGTAVTVSASELVSGSETKTANGTYDVTNLASLVVNVAGGGSAYRRIEVCPQQTATPNSSRQATLSNVVGSLSDGLHYVVTYDGSEYYTTCELLWGTDSVIGEPAILFNTASDVTYPFAIDWTSSSTLVLVANDTQQHTVKVERIELIEEPLEFVVYHTSSSEPTSSQGNDGDIWLVTE